MLKNGIYWMIVVLVETGEAHVSLPQVNFADDVLVPRVKFEQVWNLILLHLRRKFLHEILKKDTNHIRKTQNSVKYLR